MSRPVFLQVGMFFFNEERYSNDATIARVFLHNSKVYVAKVGKKYKLKMLVKAGPILRS